MSDQPDNTVTDEAPIPPLDTVMSDPAVVGALPAHAEPDPAPPSPPPAYTATQSRTWHLAIADFGVRWNHEASATTGRAVLEQPWLCGETGEVEWRPVPDAE